MLNLAHKTYLEIKKSSFLSFVLIVAICWALLSTSADICFFNDRMPNILPKLIFFVMGVMLGVGKFLFGLIAVFAQATSEIKLRYFAASGFLLLSVVSFVIGFSMFDQSFKAQKVAVDNYIEKKREINKSIEDRESIIERSILQHKIDLENNYTARSYSFYIKIKEESDKISELIRARQELKKIDLSALAIFEVCNSIVPFGKDLWQKIITVIFGSLFDLASVFFLYIIYDVSKQVIQSRSNVIFVDPKHLLRDRKI